MCILNEQYKLCNYFLFFHIVHILIKFITIIFMFEESNQVWLAFCMSSFPFNFLRIHLYCILQKYKIMMDWTMKNKQTGPSPQTVWEANRRLVFSLYFAPCLRSPQIIIPVFLRPSTQTNLDLLSVLGTPLIISRWNKINTGFICLCLIRSKTHVLEEIGAVGEGGRGHSEGCGASP